MNQYSSAGLIGLVMCAVLVFPQVPHIAIPFTVHGAVDPDFEPGTMLFLGDIMLAREVERIMEREGSAYPFAKTASLLAASDVVVGNFEASVPKVHTPTRNKHFNFNAKAEVFGLLKAHNITALSLANNHSYDSGRTGYIHTVEKCKEAGIMCAGSQKNDPNAMTEVLDVGSVRVGVLYVYAVQKVVDMETIKEALIELSASSDFQVAYIHWGEEYADTHSEEQQKLAYALVDAGIDTVIGHHPHVVQDIEVYNDAPIFYSLGNFIFDQYFSDEVQEGLLIRIAFSKDGPEYTLIPVTSIGSASQPRLMEVEKQEAYIATLLERSGFDDVALGGSYTLVVR